LKNSFALVYWSSLRYMFICGFLFSKNKQGKKKTCTVKTFVTAKVSITFVTIDLFVTINCIVVP
ncbi:hypothetical protein ACXWRI_09505, partial [Streptococcus pyogenes]